MINYNLGHNFSLSDTPTTEPRAASLVEHSSGEQSRKRDTSCFTADPEIVKLISRPGKNARIAGKFNFISINN